MFNTKLTIDAGIKYPIICGAMYPCSNPELIAAASKGGGIGIIQPVSLTMVHGYDKPNRKEGLRSGIKKIQSLTDKPIGFNALIEKGSQKYLQQMSEWIDVALEEGIRFFVTSLGKPDWVCEKVHSHGGVVYHDVTNLKFAKKGKECGVDGLICVNDRAGGHLGQLSMKQMYEQLSNLGLPLICAGGIGSEIELKEAMEVGYDGVQMGTRFIATKEAPVHENVKQAILNASELDTRLVMRPLRNTERVLNNPAVERLLQKEKDLGSDLKFEDIIDEVAGIYPKVMIEGEPEAGAWSCGMVAGLINDIPTCKELIDQIMKESEEIITSRLSGFLKN